MVVARNPEGSLEREQKNGDPLSLTSLGLDAQEGAQEGSSSGTHTPARNKPS